MACCVICACNLGTRTVKLRDSYCTENSGRNLWDFLNDIISSSSSVKNSKLTGDQSCFPCFRHLTSLAELHTVFQRKQNELLKTFAERGSKQKLGKRKAERNLPPKVTMLTREPITRPIEIPVLHSHLDFNSVIGMDEENQVTAEITITEDENGGAAIDFEVVDDAVDLKKANGLYGCRFCKKEFISSIYCINHMQEFHGKLLHNCDICDEKFRKKSELDQHRVIHLKDKPLPFQCSICPKGFNSLDKYNEHIQFHEQKKKYGCAQCGRRFVDEAKLSVHMVNHKKKPFSCHRCKKAFRNFHACKHQNSGGESQQSFYCNLCSKQFFTASSLHLHLKNHNKTHKCKICNRGFDTEEQLNVHASNHVGQKHHGCPTCGKLFLSAPQLESHLRVHTGERPYQCDACGATFSQRSNLDSHHRAVHLQEKRFKCSECDKSFKRRRLLDYHVRSVHTGERPFSCALCNASFVYPEHYKKHLMTHSGIKPYACEICGKKFRSKDNRNTHRFTHSDRKPYECQVCRASFMRKPHLLQHLIEEGHGSPETAGAAVKIVQVLTGPEVESSANEIEWSSLGFQSSENNLMLDNQIAGNIQTIIIPDENGRPIEIQVIADSQESAEHLPFDLNGETFRITGNSITELLKHTEEQECSVEETLDSLL